MIHKTLPITMLSTGADLKFREALGYVRWPSNLPLTIIFVLLAWCVALGVYRLCIHPLSCYPGPLAARISGLYGASYAWRGQLHTRTLQDHKTYGRVVRQGPSKLVFNSVQALNDIYKNELVTKSHAYRLALRPPGVSGLIDTMDRSLHRQKRKLAVRVLNERSLRDFEPTMLAQVDILIQQFFIACQGPEPAAVNVAEKFKYFTMDVMGHLALSYPLKLQTKVENRFMIDSTGTFFFNLAFQLPALTSISRLLSRIRGEVVWGREYLEVIEKMARTRLREGQCVKQDLAYMSDSGRLSESDDLWLEEILTEAIFVLSAGSDSVSACLGAVFFYLSRNPRCYHQLAQEIRSTFKHSSEIRGGPQLSSCLYLRACLDESLRMSPPLPGTLWREAAANTARPLVIDGEVVPQGTQFGVNTYAIHHNEEYFPEPFKFNPDRWLSSGQGQSRANKQAFVPFSVGARSCIGKQMAYLETSLVVAKTLWHFDFMPVTAEASASGSPTGLDAEKLGPSPPEYEIRDQYTAHHDGPLLTFRPRRM
ncbi:cytochrome P450 [Xylariomycetidae sp. FL0641]|nr:cytochrome P450 [Xylariomycetidae sp. FL0641]